VFFFFVRVRVCEYGPVVMCVYVCVCLYVSFCVCISV